MPDPITLSAEDYDALRPKDRIFLKTSGGFSAGEREFEVGRKSYSKKYKVESKRLYPVVRGEPVRRGIAKWTLYKRDNGRVSLAHGDMGTIIHEFRRALADNPDRDPYRRGPRVHVHHTFFQGPLDRAGGDGTYTKAVKAARRLAKKLKKTVYVDARGNEWIVWSYGKPSDPSAATFFGSRYHETAVEPPRANNPRSRKRNPPTFELPVTALEPGHVLMVPDESGRPRPCTVKKVTWDKRRARVVFSNCLEILTTNKEAWVDVLESSGPEANPADVPTESELTKRLKF